MDTHQLRHVLTRDLGSAFGGVYPRDLLPQTLDGKAIVINTHTSVARAEICGEYRVSVLSIYICSSSAASHRIASPSGVTTLHSD